jgi:hypothetical protein
LDDLAVGSNDACRTCGALLESGAAACGMCGTRVEPIVTETSGSAAPSGGLWPPVPAASSAGPSAADPGPSVSPVEPKSEPDPEREPTQKAAPPAASTPPAASIEPTPSTASPRSAGPAPVDVTPPPAFSGAGGPPSGTTLLDPSIGPRRLAVGSRQHTVAIGVAAVAVVALVLAILHPWSGSKSANSAAQQTVTQPVEPPAAGETDLEEDTVPQQSPESEARQIAHILQTSSHLRYRLVNTAARLNRCSRVSGDVRDLGAISRGRATLLRRAQELTSTGLSHESPLRRALISALSYSKRADDAFRKWGRELDRRGCRYRGVHSATLRAVNRYDRRATAAKQRVVYWWKRIAQEYDLPRYRESDI